MKKYFKVLFLGVALFVLSGVANAQMKIAYVNSAEILESMPESAKVKTNLEAYYNELQAQLQTMLTEYSNKVQDYEANQASLSNSPRKKKSLTWKTASSSSAPMPKRKWLRSRKSC